MTYHAELMKKASYAKDISIIEEALMIVPHIVMFECNLEAPEGCYNFSVLNIVTHRRLLPPVSVE